MWARRHWAGRHWAPRYWAGGAAVATTPPVAELEVLGGWVPFPVARPLARADQARAVRRVRCRAVVSHGPGHAAGRGRCDWTPRLLREDEEVLTLLGLLDGRPPDEAQGDFP